jgi:energy-coupling factor transport system permease protein
MNLFMYLDVDSFLHRLDPRTKMLIVAYCMATALMFIIPAYQLGLLVATLFYCALGKCLGNVFKMRFVYVSIFLVSFLMWTLTVRGQTPLFGFITLEGVNKGVSAGLGLIVIVLSSLAFISTTKIEELTAGLLKLGLPYKGAFALSTAIRMVPMIVGTGYTILQAQKSRGLDVESGSVIARLKKYIPLMVPAIVSTIRGTNVFAMALESKGFGYSDTRTEYMQLRYKAADYFITILMLVMLALSVFVKFRFNL